MVVVLGEGGELVGHTAAAAAVGAWRMKMGGGFPPFLNLSRQYPSSLGREHKRTLPDHHQQHNHRVT